MVNLLWYVCRHLPKTSNTGNIGKYIPYKDPMARKYLHYRSDEITNAGQSLELQRCHTILSALRFPCFMVKKKVSKHFKHIPVNYILQVTANKAKKKQLDTVDARNPAPPNMYETL